MCTHCSRKENGTVKHLKIWTTPPVLIIHLKRFCQTKISNSKLTYPVQFPLVNLNIKRFLSTNRNLTDGDEDENEIDHGQEDFIENQNETQYGLYDLFAVCNHRGSMSNGHYTGKNFILKLTNKILDNTLSAYCKNPITDKWFCYDDHLVTELDPSRVCTPDAYILFYKRRDTSPSPSPSPSSQSTPKYSSPSPQDHVDSIANEFNEHLNLDPSTSIEDKKPQNSLQAPLPLPRKLIPSVQTTPSEDESSLPPCPLPRTRIPKPTAEITIQPIPSARQQTSTTARSSEPLNDVQTERISPWSRFNNYRYSNDEPESNVVYPKPISR